MRHVSAAAGRDLQTPAHIITKKVNRFTQELIALELNQSVLLEVKAQRIAYITGV